MIDKTMLEERIKEGAAIICKYSFLKNEIIKINNISTLVKEYAFRVILIGGFSSGKSALLNKLVGRKLFKEDESPETAVPAEISWGSSDQAVALLENGSVVSLSLEKPTYEVPPNTSIISIKIDDSFFRNHKDLILVDFPGFDSNYEAHNKAINLYLEKGSAFILLIPSKNGTLTSSDKKFVKEASHYPQSLACFISKSDLMIPEQLTEVKKSVQAGIHSIYGFEVPLDIVSAKTGSREEVYGKIETIVNRFDPQLLFKLRFTPILNECFFNAVNAMKEYKEASQLDVSELDRKMADFERNIKEISYKFELEKRKLAIQYQHEILPDLLGKIEEALNNNESELLIAAKSGQQRLIGEIQNIVRPILNDFRLQMQYNLKDFAEGLDLDFGSGSETNSVKQFLVNIIDAICSTGSLGKGRGNSITISLSWIQPVLAIIGNVAKGLLNLIFGESLSEEERENRLQQLMRNRVLPQIKNKIETQIRPMIENIQEQMLGEIKERFDQNMASEKAALQQAKSEKEDKISQHHANLAILEKHIQALENLMIRE